jgi:hypothetical protein
MPQMAVDFRISQSHKKVIESSVEPSVNGFGISVSNDDKFFTYGSKIESYILPQTSSPGFSVMGLCTAQDGGYSVHFFPPNPNHTALAIYVIQGRFGIIYKSNDGGLLQPEVFSNIEESEFAKITESRYGKIASVRTPRQKINLRELSNKQNDQRNG